ncbi:unnamed protein product [Penicillium salamii]|uniref:FAD-binding PCMH-type domain-containing protein n=1 Tax=Penicillium salamii TaxID=1612424 RepID=A0A9W4IEH4_9EURO|nr:unnamed protein product [Penicillium salamii]CAG8237378.1 unnamed protein product [Penicillium salamii]CAG8251025.1 unnamed protein product [Penicillium salamii]CAG8265715.1 unnamed protein product [Penicillium salamii]CAG8351509.1 unnamed protein product [Penicillium salamii]
MATLDSLKLALKQSSREGAPTQRLRLSDKQYRDGFNIIAKGRESMMYKDFIIPQLCHLLPSLFHLRANVSVLEIGPGPESVLFNLPEYLRQRITKYTAFEPNKLFAKKLEARLGSSTGTGSSLPGLDSPAIVHQDSFDSYSPHASDTGPDGYESNEKFDLILFCHSLYGINPKRSVIDKALGFLAEKPASGMVVVFHREGSLRLDGLASHKTASYPVGTVCVPDDNRSLDRFAAFVAGFTLPNDEAIRTDWRKTCRDLGHRDLSHPGQLVFSSPDMMVAFQKSATALLELDQDVLVIFGNLHVKNREACFHHPACIAQPTDLDQIQKCVLWALKHKIELTVIGGGHSGHCLWPNVVAIDMSDFRSISFETNSEDNSDMASSEGDFTPEPLLVVSAGCTTGDIIHRAMDRGLTVPLGSRPSVGAGLWLQGGIGHLARLHGLSCDSIIGAIVIDVNSGKILCLGFVSGAHWPPECVFPENSVELLWALKGAGPSVGIVYKVVFKTYQARTYSVQDWVVPLSDPVEVSVKLNEIGLVAEKLPRNCSIDAYLYWDLDRLNIGVTKFESHPVEVPSTTLMSSLLDLDPILGQGTEIKTMDGVKLFDAEFHMAHMHGGHVFGKTSSFKRCLFLKDLGETDVSSILTSALKNRPTELCYFHLLQGGGAVRDHAPRETAFGCRDWDFACVITGVWHRKDDSTPVARRVVDWVYRVAEDLLQLGCGVYHADLGPDPRDAVLVANAFGPNLERLAGVRNRADPHDILAYTFPISKWKNQKGHKLVFLISGKSCAGKDYCAAIWASTLRVRKQMSFETRVVSISTAIKMAYAVATGADITRLLNDRAYKEQHRPALSSFFNSQLLQQPRLLEEQFVNLVNENLDVDVLFITGIRDKAPVANLSHLVPDRKLFEIRVQASDTARQTRKGIDNSEFAHDYESSSHTDSGWRPNLVFNNETTGSEAAEQFAIQRLSPLLHGDTQRLANMVRVVPDFPSPGINFRHVLGIAQQYGGLVLCTSLLESCIDDWEQIDIMVSCEAGGFVFASPLALRVKKPLALIRAGGKVPPPTYSVSKTASHISDPLHSKETIIELERNAIPKRASVVLVDDVLASGRTMCAMLRLLEKAHVRMRDVSVLVVAEFPIHAGRRYLHQCGFGMVCIRSLLVFDGA